MFSLCIIHPFVLCTIKNDKVEQLLLLKFNLQVQVLPILIIFLQTIILWELDFHANKPIAIPNKSLS